MDIKKLEIKLGKAGILQIKKGFSWRAGLFKIDHENNEAIFIIDAYNGNQKTALDIVSELKSQDYSDESILSDSRLIRFIKKFKIDEIMNFKIGK